MILVAGRSLRNPGCLPGYQVECQREQVPGGVLGLNGASAHHRTNVSMTRRSETFRDAVFVDPRCFQRLCWGQGKRGKNPSWLYGVAHGVGSLP